MIAVPPPNSRGPAGALERYQLHEPGAAASHWGCGRVGPDGVHDAVGSDVEVRLRHQVRRHQAIWSSTHDQVGSPSAEIFSCTWDNR